MKNTSLSSLSLAITFLFLSFPVYANQASRSGVKKDKIVAIQEKIQEKKDNLAKLHADRLEKRFSNYYTRLSALIVKIQARIDANSDKDTSISQEKLNSAKTKLEEAKILGASAINMFRALEPEKWSEQRKKAISARDTAIKAKEAFKVVHGLMIDAIKSLKSANAK